MKSKFLCQVKILLDCIKGDFAVSPKEVFKMEDKKEAKHLDQEALLVQAELSKQAEMDRAIEIKRQKEYQKFNEQRKIEYEKGLRTQYQLSIKLYVKNERGTFDSFKKKETEVVQKKLEEVVAKGKKVLVNLGEGVEKQYEEWKSGKIAADQKKWDDQRNIQDAKELEEKKKEINKRYDLIKEKIEKQLKNIPLWKEEKIKNLKEETYTEGDKYNVPQVYNNISLLIPQDTEHDEKPMDLQAFKKWFDENLVDDGRAASPAALGTLVPALVLGLGGPTLETLANDAAAASSAPPAAIGTLIPHFLLNAAPAGSSGKKRQAPTMPKKDEPKAKESKENDAGPSGSKKPNDNRAPDLKKRKALSLCVSHSAKVRKICEEPFHIMDRVEDHCALDDSSSALSLCHCLHFCVKNIPDKQQINDCMKSIVNVFETYFGLGSACDSLKAIFQTNSERKDRLPSWMIVSQALFKYHRPYLLVGDETDTLLELLMENIFDQCEMSPETISQLVKKNLGETFLLRDIPSDEDKLSEWKKTMCGYIHSMYRLELNQFETHREVREHADSVYNEMLISLYDEADY